MLISLLALAAPSLAEEPTATAKYRQTVMRTTGGHMRSSAAIVKGKVDRKGDLAAHARAMHDVSLTLTELFPKGTEPGAVKTDAKPEIWTKWSEFELANKAFQDATQKLVDAAEKGDDAAIKAAFGAVGKSCGGCHDTFKVEDDH